VGLRTRLLLITSLVLGAGLTLTGWILDRSFAASVTAGAEEQLRLVIYGLLGAAEENGAALEFPDGPSEPRLAQPESGLYAIVEDADGEVIWRSPSYQLTAQLNELDNAGRPAPLPGQFLFVADPAHFYMAYSVIWEAADDAQFTFRVFVDQAPFRAEIGSFRRSLTVGLAGAVLLLIVVQYVAVAWGLRPVGRMADRVRALEAGERTEMGDDYPLELKGLASNLDRFVVNEAEHRTRYRTAMDDLAHSLKTPLAVLRNALGDEAEIERPLMNDQLDRMESTVAHQLARAVAAAPLIGASRVALEPMAARIVSALERAYADKRVATEIVVAEGVSVKGDERDLMEMLGNLLENAFKYCRSRVRFDAVRGDYVVVRVSDDGDGVDPALRSEVLKRGARADTANSGQGIGLAMVVELAASYGGRVEIGASDLGGAMVTLELPG
jgi:two-component system sensor histidine kinase PhoQ